MDVPGADTTGTDSIEHVGESVPVEDANLAQAVDSDPHELEYDNEQIPLRRSKGRGSDTGGRSHQHLPDDNMDVGEPVPVDEANLAQTLDRGPHEDLILSDEQIALLPTCR